MDRAGVRWRKAAKSGSQSNCVELAHTGNAVRDSKNPNGGMLIVDLTGLLSAIKADVVRS